MINQLELQWQRKTGRGEREPIHQWLSFASPFLSLSQLLQSSWEVLLRQNSQSVTEVSWQHCCEGYFFHWAADRVWSIFDNDFGSTLSSILNLQYEYRLQELKVCSSGVSIETEGLTLLSELGIMVSVIQEPNLDPDARTVMGLLTPVSFPQPGGQRRERYKTMCRT